MKQPIIHLLIIVLLTLAVYSNIWSNQFVSDDISFIVNWETTRSWTNIVKLFTGEVPVGNEGVYRPIRSLWYVLAYHLGGNNLWFYHAWSIGVHILGTGTVYFLAKKLLSNSMQAFWASLIFGVHSVHVESITNMTASFDSFGIVLMLISMWLWTKNKHSMAWIFGGFAGFTSEFALLLPVFLLSLNWFSNERNSRWWWGFVGFDLLYVWLRVYVWEIPARGIYLGNSFWFSLMAGLKTLPIYGQLLLFPWRLTLDHTIPPGIPSVINPNLYYSGIFAQRWSDGWVIFSSIFLIVILSLIIYHLRRNKTISLSLGWMLVSLLPVSNLLPSYTIMHEMYLYLASVGFCLLVASRIKSKRTYLVGVIIYIIFLGSRTYLRNYDWRDEVSLWQATLNHSPNNPMISYQLGMAYYLNGDYVKARDMFINSLLINQKFTVAQFTLGMAYEALGEDEEMLIWYKAALMNDPENQLYQQKYQEIVKNYRLQSLDTGL